jgi:hypothetical protein
MTTDVERREALDLVKLDYERTLAFIDGVVSISSGIRRMAVTVYLALAAVALDRDSWELFCCAIAATGLFWFLDAYHGWLYREGLLRGRKLERLLRLRYSQMLDEDDEDAEADLNEGLEKHRFGHLLTIPPFRFRSLFQARPRRVFIALYGSMLFGATAGALVTAL